MGIAVDTVGLQGATGVNPAFAALAALTGDSLQIRSFAQTDQARLEAIIFGTPGAAGRLRITSPKLHDNVTGLTFQPPEQPQLHMIPREVGVPMFPGDTLVASAGTTAASTAVVGLINYYRNLPGQAARLTDWPSLKGNIKAIKPIEVVTSAAIAAWTDTPVNTTDKQLHARSDYAVLGFQTSAACDLVGVKGQETGNLRNCGSGAAATFDVSEWFIAMSEQQGTPHIPVFNADNQGAFNVSTLHSAAIATLSVFLILAELMTPFAG